jgi:hypothetical protein
MIHAKQIAGCIEGISPFLIFEFLLDVGVNQKLGARKRGQTQTKDLLPRNNTSYTIRPRLRTLRL